MPHGLVDRRGDVDHVMELRAHAARVLDPRRPRDGQRIPHAAQVRGDLLGPLERRVHRPRPAGGEVVEVLRPAELVDVLEVVLERLRHVVEERVLVEQADEPALGRGAVVAHLVEDERVVGVGQRADDLEQPAHLVVGLRR